jgi:ABC-2 type transport system ATP-binding protein
LDVTPAVTVTALSKYFPLLSLRRLLTLRRPQGLWALREVDFRLEAGESLCIVGPNGSGKTTLIKLIATLLLPTQGRILVHGHDTRREPDRAKRHLGMVTCNEYSFYGRLTGWQNLAFFARLHNLNPREAIPPVVETLKLTPYLNRRFFTYSTGIRRRVDIARGLLHDPDIILMDEPTTNLDPIAATEVRQLLAQFRSQGKTLITVTHRLEEARQLGRRLAVMVEGRFHEIHPGAEENLEDLYRRAVLGGSHAQ